MGIAFIIAIYSIIQISTLPISDFYGVIQAGLGNSYNGYGLVSAYSVIYILVILMLIGIFAIVFVRKEKTKKAIMTRAQVAVISNNFLSLNVVQKIRGNINEHIITIYSL